MSKDGIWFDSFDLRIGFDHSNVSVGGVKLDRRIIGRSDHRVDTRHHFIPAIFLFGEIVANLSVVGPGDQMERCVTRDEGETVPILDRGVDGKPIGLPPVVSDGEISALYREVEIAETVVSKQPAAAQTRLCVLPAHSINQNFAVLQIDSRNVQIIGNNDDVIDSSGAIREPSLSGRKFRGDDYRFGFCRRINGDAVQSLSGVRFLDCLDFNHRLATAVNSNRAVLIRNTESSRRRRRITLVDDLFQGLITSAATTRQNHAQADGRNSDGHPTSVQLAETGQHFEFYRITPRECDRKSDIGSPHSRARA